MLSRRYYESIAQRIRNTAWRHPDDQRIAAERLGNFFWSDNPDFDMEWFVAACSGAPDGEEGGPQYVVVERPEGALDAVGKEALDWAALHPKETERLAVFAGLMLEELAANDSKGNRPAWMKMDRKEAVAEVFWHAAKLAVAAKEMGEPVPPPGGSGLWGG